MAPARSRRRWQDWRSCLKELWARYGRDQIPLASAAIAFYLVLSMIPLALLLVSVAAFIVPQATIRVWLSSVVISLGAGVGSAVQTEVLNVVRHRGVLTGITLVFDLWTGSQIFGTIELALNQVWHTQSKRSFFVSRGLALLMTVIIGILAVIAFLLTYLLQVAELSSMSFLRHLGVAGSILAWLISIVIPVILVTVTFMLIYRIMPSKKIPLRYLFPGALLAAIAWEIVLITFSWYSAAVANYSVLYGSLGGLVLLMLWFNYSATVMLLGAEFSAIYYEHKSGDHWEEAEEGEKPA